MTTTSLGFGIATTRDPAWDEAKARLWAMTPDERIAAMRAGTLPMRLLCHWANHAPDEVPLLVGEFEFIAIPEPGYADAVDVVATVPAAGARERA